MDTLHYTISITETELINLSDAIIQARVQAITIMEDNKQDANMQAYWGRKVKALTATKTRLNQALAEQEPTYCTLQHDPEYI